MNLKDYNQHQLFLYPPTFEDFIPECHPVRIVNDVIDNIKIDPLLKAYKKEGNPSYHPKMMLKIMMYAYMDNTYSSRRIEKSVKRDSVYQKVHEAQLTLFDLPRGSLFQQN